MKEFLDQWKSYEKKSLLAEGESVLNEVSDEALELISGWLGKVPSNSLSFNNIFGDGNKRIMIPFNPPQEGDLNTPFGRMMNYFESAGAKVDFSDGTLSQEVSSERSDKKQIRKTRIGKWFNKAASMREKVDKLNIVWRAAREKEGDDASEEINTYKAAKNLQDKMEKEFGRKLSYTNVSEIKEMAQFWATKSEYYRQNPNAAEGEKDKYSIIFSRSPVDVLRMSDFENIESCHSPDQGYFQCAVGEARGHGLVAFVVENEQWNFASKEHELDLQDEEIFADISRDQPGISPKSRVRLRKYTYSSPFDGEVREMAVPEDRIYGKRFPDFLETVLGWSRTAQPEVVKMSEEGNIPVIDSYTRYGGSYADSSDGKLLNNILDIKEYDQHRDVKHDSSDDESIDGTPAMEEAVAEVDAWAERMFAYGAYINGEVYDDGDGPYVIMDAGIEIKIPMEELNDTPSSADNFEEDFNHFINMDVREISYRAPSWGGQLGDFIISISVNTEDYYGVDGYDTLASDVNSELDDRADQIEEGIREVFMNYGYMAKEDNTSDEYKEWHKELEDLDVEYKSFDVFVDEEEIELTTASPRLMDVSDFTSVLSHFVLPGYTTSTTEPNDQRRLRSALKNVISISNANVRQISRDISKLAVVQVKNQISLPGFDESVVDEVVIPNALEILISHAGRDYGPDATEISIVLKVQILVDGEGEDANEVMVAKTFMSWADNNHEMIMNYIEEELSKKIGKAIDSVSEFEGGTKAAVGAINSTVSEVQTQIEKVKNLVKEAEPFQNYAKNQNNSAKNDLLVKGGNKYKAKPFSIGISTKRAKSAPPGAGGS